ncbi:cupin domain-containing protein [Tunturiibacter lichenicola]|uniref:cupin domain-containing protein n=1 Tax=Tunturiibacter lichenicola TaxID=2051959 RepID=UPI0021B16C34|nr:cupin domain-containing protein [Edaphobacter lichenicola]
MPPIKTFKVFGERIDVLVNAATTEGASAAIIQHIPPGGGPPPHSHRHEDETFYVLEGEIEFLHEGEWSPVGVGDTAFGLRGVIHSFRNAGTTAGRVLIFIAPAGLEDYLEEISAYSPATDMPKIVEISKRFGITFYP